MGVIVRVSPRSSPAPLFLLIPPPFLSSPLLPPNPNIKRDIFPPSRLWSRQRGANVRPAKR